MSSKIFAYVGIVIMFYYLTYAIFNGITHPIPALGDSWDYHIPIAKMILTGEVFSPKHPIITQWYYPGSSEAVNSLFILLNIPLTLTNILAVIVLFFICWKLGGVFRLNYYESIFFAATVVTLNSLVRWYNSVNIDIWLVNFFFLSVILLERPKSSLKYFLVLGITIGMLVGTKFTGFYYAVILFVFYGKRVLPHMSISKLLIFLIPFSIFGLSWYIRNTVLFHNPFYPLYFMGLPYTINFDKQVWNTFLGYPKDMLDAFFSEYKVWTFAILLIVFQLLRRINGSFESMSQLLSLYKLEILSLLCFTVLLLSPSDSKTWIMVSSMRYSYAAFILAILAIFRYFKSIKKGEMLGIISLASAVMVTSFNYYPKLIVIYTPLSLFFCYLFERYKKKLQYFFS